VKRENEEQTASLQTALLHRARDARVVRTLMRTAQHLEIGSERLCAVITADFAPWINRLRR
jgi:urease gamma subunit